MATVTDAPVTQQRDSRDSFQVAPFARFEHQTVDWLDVIRRKHTAHLLLEFDVTRALDALYAHEIATGERLSLTAFVAACLAQAIDENKRMHAYRKGRGRLMLFDDVDVAMISPSDAAAGPPAPPHIIRAANRKSVGEIEREMRAAAAERPGITLWLPFWLLLPATVRTRIWRAGLNNPRLRKRITGTVSVSTLGAPASGARWSIPLTGYTLALQIGGLAQNSSASGERVSLYLTLSVDDDIINGPAAAQFAARLQELVEGAMGLPGHPIVRAARPLIATNGAGDPRESPALATPGAGGRESARAATAIRVVKAIHTFIFLGIGACVLEVCYAGLTDRFSGRTRLALTTTLAEAVIFARGGFRCPLADLAEDLGAAQGTVGDIFLPAWFARRIPIISSALLAIGFAAQGRRRWAAARRPERGI